jgi:hypothetical protein
LLRRERSGQVARGNGVQSREITAELTPHVRGWQWLELEVSEGLAMDPLVDDIGDRNQVAGIVEDKQFGRAYAGLTRGGHRYRLPIQRLNVFRMVAWDAQHVVLAEEVHRVEDASFRELDQRTICLQSMAGRNGSQNFS